MGSIQSFDVWRHALNVGAREEVMWRIATPGETTTANEVEAKLEHSSMNVYEDQHGWCCAYCEKERKPFRCDDFADIMIHLHIQSTSGVACFILNAITD